MRPSWDEYFMGITEIVAKRATCPRKRLGSIIVKNKRIIATGYNGSPPGQPHCDDVGCLIVPTVKIIKGKQVVRDHCLRTLHAEQNALLQCAIHGVSTKDATMFTLTNPCYLCAKMIITAGIKRVVYKDEYNHDDALDQKASDLLKEGGVELIKLMPQESK